MAGSIAGLEAMLFAETAPVTVLATVFAMGVC